MTTLLEIQCFVNGTRETTGWINPHHISFARSSLRATGGSPELVPAVIIEFLEGTAVIVDPKTWREIQRFSGLTIQKITVEAAA